MALRLHAVTVADAQHPSAPLDRNTGSWAVPVLPTGLALVPFRDLCAVVSEQKAFVLDERGPEAVAEHRAVVDAVFRNGPVLPAPVGVVFRAPDVLKRWMELHYVSLSDALAFVEDRAV
ncbi:MAG TPA: GvpL/GvpF family gas vesicle protein, partial [Gemmatimonadaceae bacterium]